MSAGPGTSAASGEDAGSPPLGRDRELAAVAAAVGTAVAGTGAVLVLRGAHGTGRTTLLAHAPPGAAATRPLTTAGVRPETAVPGAGLHRLLRPIGHRLAALPAAHRDAARWALGEPVQRPEPLVLGAATVALLAAGAHERPLLCRVDDADRLDPISLAALGFAARRVAGAAGLRAAMLLAATDPWPAGPGFADPCSLDGLPATDVGPLGEAASRRLVTDLLARGEHGPAPHDLVTALLHRAHGNPLALRELAESLTPAQVHGVAALPEGLPDGSRLHAHHLERIGALPAASRTALLVAATAHRLHRDALIRACAAARIGTDALEPLRRSGLLVLDGDQFVVPDRLLRASVRTGAALADRVAAHRLLAGVLDHESQRAARAWHRAATVDAPGEELASELRDAAAVASAAGDHAAASRCLQRSAELTTTAGAAGDRLVAAARAAWQTGDGRRARLLLGEARPLAGTSQLRGFVDLLAGEIELRTGTVDRAYDALADVADGLGGPGRVQAVLALLRAGETLMLAGDHPRFIGLAHRIAELPCPDELPEARLMFELFAGVSASLLGDHARASRSLSLVVDLGPQSQDPSALVLTTIAAVTLGDEVRSQAIAAQAVARCRATGAFAALPVALELLAFTEFWRDDYASAAVHAREALRRAQDAGQQNTEAAVLSVLAMLSTLTGEDEGAIGRAKAASLEARGRGLTRPTAFTVWATTRQALAAGRPDDAAPALRMVCGAWPRGMHQTIQVMATPDLLEIALHRGDREWAERALAMFEGWADGVGSPAMRALGARSHALLAEDPDEAQERFDVALALHGGRGLEFERARTQLLYGRALRRRRRPGQAREHLQDALGTFERFGARPWSEQARSELRAAGGTAGPPAPRRAVREAAPRPAATEALTPQQYEIARLVAGGATNREVAAQLFLSPRTVDHHLRNVFVRLGVRSRVELARLLG